MSEYLAIPLETYTRITGRAPAGICDKHLIVEVEGDNWNETLTIKASFPTNEQALDVADKLSVVYSDVMQTLKAKH